MNTVDLHNSSVYILDDWNDNTQLFSCYAQNVSNFRLNPVKNIPVTTPTVLNIIDYIGHKTDHTNIEPFSTTTPINVLIQGPFLPSIKLVDPETQTL